MRVSDADKILEDAGFDIRGFYCSTRVSWKLAEAADWLHGAAVEALTRPDTRVFYLIMLYYQLVSILAMCHEDIAREVSSKTKYQVFRDGKIVEIIERIKRL